MHIVQIKERVREAKAYKILYESNKTYLLKANIILNENFMKSLNCFFFMGVNLYNRMNFLKIRFIFFTRNCFLKIKYGIYMIHG